MRELTGGVSVPGQGAQGDERTAIIAGRPGLNLPRVPCWFGPPGWAGVWDGLTGCVK